MEPGHPSAILGIWVQSGIPSRQQKDELLRDHRQDVSSMFVDGRIAECIRVRLY